MPGPCLGTPVAWLACDDCLPHGMPSASCPVSVLCSAVKGGHTPAPVCTHVYLFMRIDPFSHLWPVDVGFLCLVPPVFSSEQLILQ